MGRSARGVNGIKLQDGDHVAGMVATTDEDGRALLTVTKNGFGKRTLLSEYRTQSRYGKGLIDIKTDERNGRVSTAKAVTDDDHLVIMSESGQIMRIRAGDISQVGRNTKGVTIMELEAGDQVASVTVVPANDDESPASDEQ
jgi:DNA gyrase subunit A